MSRRDSREAAVKIVFQNMFTDSRLSISDSQDQGGGSLSDAKDCSEMIDVYYDSISEDREAALDRVYIQNVLEGVIEHVSEIDRYVMKYSKDWTIDRMSKMDLAIMRVAIFEILFRDDIPVSVSINEAVELAKKYSHKDAGSFINGILGSVYSDSDT